MDKIALKKDVTTRMDSAIKSLDNELKGLRTGRASVNFLDPVTVDAYGSRSAISQVATVSTPEPRIIMVQVWDKSLLKAVEKAISEANLGVNPVIDGQMIRIVLPILSEERRKELVKLAYKYGENIKVSLRNIRRDIVDNIKKLEKDKVISEDIQFALTEELQKITTEYNDKVDSNVKQKEQEILTM